MVKATPAGAAHAHRPQVLRSGAAWPLPFQCDLGSPAPSRSESAAEPCTPHGRSPFLQGTRKIRLTLARGAKPAAFNPRESSPPGNFQAFRTRRVLFSHALLVRCDT
eukprot:6212865-Pleurochrysis_carterae.AAC.3